MKNMDELKQSASSGDVRSQLKLAWAYARGDFGHVDLNAAKDLFIEAKKHNSIEADFNYGRFIDYMNDPEGVVIIKHCARRGLPIAQYYYARLLYATKKRSNMLRALVFLKDAMRHGDLSSDFVYHAKLVMHTKFYKKPCCIFLAIVKYIAVVRQLVKNPDGISI